MSETSNNATEHSVGVKIGRQMMFAFCWLSSMAMFSVCVAVLFHVDQFWWQAGLVFGAVWNTFTAIETWLKMVGIVP